MKRPGAEGATSSVTGRDAAPWYSTMTSVVDVAATAYGTIALTCVANEWTTGAATPSNSTRVPPAAFSSNPVESKPARLSAAGPRRSPKMVTISPGATGPGAKLAAFTTPVRE